MIYLLLVGCYVLLAISFLIHDRTLGLLSAMGLMAVGIYLAVDGISYINNFLVQTISILTIAIGAYFFIAGGLQGIEETYG